MKPIHIKVEKGHKCPVGNQATDGVYAALRLAIGGLKIGTGLDTDESFVWQNNHAPHRSARDIGTRVTVRKINGDGYRVWRTK